MKRVQGDSQEIKLRVRSEVRDTFTFAIAFLFPFLLLFFLLIFLAPGQRKFNFSMEPNHNGVAFVYLS